MVTSNNVNPIRFANRVSDEIFDLLPDVWDILIDKLNEALDERKIILLDEIGHLQLKEEKFGKFVKKLLADHDATIFATIPLDKRTSPLLSYIKQHYRTTILHLMEGQNEKYIENELRREIQSSLYLAQIMPASLWKGKE